MYVFMYIYIYVNIYIHIFICLYLYYTFKYIFTYMYIYISIYVYSHTYIWIYVYMYIHMYICICLYISYTCIYIYIYICIHIYVFIYMLIYVHMSYTHTDYLLLHISRSLSSAIIQAESEMRTFCTPSSCSPRPPNTDTRTSWPSRLGLSWVLCQKKSMYVWKETYKRGLLTLSRTWVDQCVPCLEVDVPPTAEKRSQRIPIYMKRNL